MIKQVMVIGLGQFGAALCKSLSKRGVEVLAVDYRQEMVQAISPFVSQALCFNATDEQTLARTAPDRRDLCVCAIGDESRESSILVTALLRQMGAKRVVARATDELQERILRLVGAHEVVNPERSFGERMASRLQYHSVLQEFPLGDDLLITEITVPAFMFGKTLAELDLTKQYGITLVAVRRFQDEKINVVQPHANTKLMEGDSMVLVSDKKALDKFMTRLSQ
ncbi:MAG: TrkA family potassium uptake protein [Acidobacteria bacterium]|nr:TrkA family potassium uptake protein [Acidobacteriota bacterium]